MRLETFFQIVAGDLDNSVDRNNTTIKSFRDMIKSKKGEIISLQPMMVKHDVKNIDLHGDIEGYSELHYYHFLFTYKAEKVDYNASKQRRKLMNLLLGGLQYAIK